ncbi:hypothetical protein EGW08_018011 [Elysia chlorotica]|uniref:EGF-like domain-containing protein n=1 Tax=Elysia chlorotica TaxID=188477 RepID=A0A433SY54_ELYCH|nr:hypothetical protein EGW08_018011 [Elysia chlorotica]
MRHCTKSFPHFHKCLARISFPRPSKLAVVAALFLVILSLQPEQSDARFGMFSFCIGTRCVNGGTTLASKSPFGKCRCRFPPSFEGPNCEYPRDKVIDSQTMNLIREHLLDLAKMLNLLEMRTPSPV